MVPLDQLFATLDVTVHAGLLPNRLKVLYVDTVGFISDIPSELIASFGATLEDMLTAVRLHQRDQRIFSLCSKLTNDPFKQARRFRFSWNISGFSLWGILC